MRNIQIPYTLRISNKNYLNLFKPHIPLLMIIAVGMILPSDNSHGLLSPKSLLFISTMIGFILHLLTRIKIKKTDLNIIFYFTTCSAILLTWLIIGSINNPLQLSSGLDQLKLFLITLTIPALTIYYILDKKIDPRNIVLIAIKANFFYITLKIFALILHLLGIIDIWQISESLNLAVMSTTIFGNLSRFQSSVDISTPFLVLFVLQSDPLGLQMSKKFKFSFIFVALFSTLISFSRFLIAAYFLCFFLYTLTLNLKKTIKIIISIILFSLLLVLSIGVDNFSTGLENRFFSYENYVSDDTRYKQINALLSQYEETPLLGQGLGGTAKDYLRNDNVEHSYEVQWIAFLMQFGIIGITIILIPLTYIFIKLIIPFSRLKLSFALLYLYWLSSGFTNPFLISLQSGIIYTLFLLVPILINPKITNWYIINKFNNLNNFHKEKFNEK